eukprot:Sspe_Gene.64435::Locus_38097_Transcript_1_1_Confidence_1.000_Length_872::g.64435::m.64435/K20359/RABAC1, PRAF1; PRA1 family protein 1
MATEESKLVETKEHEYQDIDISKPVSDSPTIEVARSPSPVEQLSFIDVRQAEMSSQSPQQDTDSAWGKITIAYQQAQEFRMRVVQNMRPWGIVFDRSRYSVPSRSQVWGRVTTNVRYFHGNYMALLAVLTIWTAISNLVFVMAMMMSGLALWYYRVQTRDGATFIMRGREVSPVQFYSGLSAVTLFMFWLTGGGSTIFWLILSALILVVGHSACFEVDEMLVAESSLPPIETFGGVANVV